MPTATCRSTRSLRRWPAVSPAPAQDNQTSCCSCLLRSSGDERADQIRLGVLRSYGERLASAAGWHPERHDDDQLILRAQLVLAASTGITLLRKSGLQPLASAHEQDLVGPLRDMVDALLSPR